jgi:4-diphosphocytidyl-2-C-methyl-D-erythritol kinase
MSISHWSVFASSTRGTARALRYRAYAKVNVSLEVLGKRPDGYHDLASVMQTVSLCDEIEIAEDVDVRFACSDPALEGDDNLVPRAARLLRGASNNASGCKLMLHKAIPHAAGLGGGSSDAAETLRALNALWSLHLSLQQLVDIGSRLGSDVLFFLYGGTALVTGRGEFVRPLPAPEPVWYALAKPPISVPTAAVFNAVSREDWTNGASTRAVAAGICDRRQVTLGMNGLQRALFRLFPPAQECFEDVSRVAPGRAFVSGSGPTIGASCGSQLEAEQVVTAVAREGRWTAVVHSAPDVGG